MNELTVVGKKPTPEEISKLADAIRDMPQHNFEVKHHFSPGVYARELTIPKGATAVGCVHLHENMNMLVKGHVQVTTEEGVVDVHAPFIVVSPPGTQRALHAVEDSVWVTIHGTHETDLDVLRKTFVVDTHEQYLEHVKAKELTCHG
jgi:quercetin dioxygenase-like cupin family protein